LYSKGEIPSFEEGFLKTGGIYFTGIESDSEVLINSKPQKQTGIFSRDFLVKNIRPGMYDVEIKKDGYNSWQKDVKVFDNKVSEVRAFYLSKDIKIQKIAELTYSDTEVASTSIKAKGIPNQEYKDVQALFKDYYSQKAKQILSTSTSGLSVKDIKSVKDFAVKRRVLVFTDGGRIKDYWTGDINNIPNFFCEDFICTNKIETSFEGKSILSVAFFPGRNDVALFSVPGAIYAIELENNSKKQLQLIYKGSNPGFMVYNDTIVYIKDGKYLGKIEF
jgi:hypothetical protein